MNYNSNPDINDWNEDGKKDLIVGEQTYISPNTGTIRCYLNSGTNEAPVFDDYTVLQAGGNDIYRYRANPRIFDLDQDGLKDLVVGDNTGQVFFYKNVGTNAAPSFDAAYEALKTKYGTVIDANYGSRFHFVDWTMDGDFDMLISGYDGYVQLYENTTLGVDELHDEYLANDFDVYPNPVADRAVLRYSLNKSTLVRAQVYSADGRHVTTLINQYQEPGNHQFVWNVSDETEIPTGIYFITFDTDSEQHSQRILVIH